MAEVAEIRSGCLSGVPERNCRQLLGKIASDNSKEEGLELVLLALVDHVDAHVNLIARIGAFVHLHDAALENVVVTETKQLSDGGVPGTRDITQMHAFAADAAYISGLEKATRESQWTAIASTAHGRTQTATATPTTCSVIFSSISSFATSGTSGFAILEESDAHRGRKRRAPRKRIAHHE